MNKLSAELNKMMEAYPANFRMGVRHGRGISLRRPSFDCDWYWGFGYLGNTQCHYHLNSLETMDWQNDGLRDKNLFDQLKIHFGDSLTIKDDADLWKFCEIVTTIYTLKEAAELFCHGGSNYSTNPDKDFLKDDAMYLRIVKEMIPAQIASLYRVLEKYQKEFRP